MRRNWKNVLIYLVAAMFIFYIEDTEYVQYDKESIIIEDDMDEREAGGEGGATSS